MMSMLVRPSGDLTDPHLATSAVGLSAAEAIEIVTGRAVGIKWPNDLVAGTAAEPDDRKLCGILAEAVASDGAVEAIVVGVGINVNWPDDLPEDLAATAASVRHLVGHEVDRTDLVVELLRRLEANLADAADPVGRVSLRERITERSATVGRSVRVERSDGFLEGIATGLTDDGELIIENDAGTTVVSVGDVIHLRPTA